MSEIKVDYGAEIVHVFFITLLVVVITRQADCNEVQNTRVFRGADCSSDHNMVCSKISFSVQKKTSEDRKETTKKTECEQT